MRKDRTSLDVSGKSKLEAVHGIKYCEQHLLLCKDSATSAKVGLEPDHLVPWRISWLRGFCLAFIRAGLQGHVLAFGNGPMRNVSLVLGDLPGIDLTCLAVSHRKHAWCLSGHP